MSLGKVLQKLAQRGVKDIHLSARPGAQITEEDAVAFLEAYLDSKYERVEGIGDSHERDSLMT